MNYYDYIIVGSGIAGLYTALMAKEYGTVLILTKGGIDDCNTRHAQGGIAAPLDKKDSPEIHYKDTIAAGDGLCDPEAVRILTDEATDRIADLIKRLLLRPKKRPPPLKGPKNRSCTGRNCLK